MASFFGLECLARFAPQLFGRALSLDAVLGSSSVHLGRSNRLDAHTQEVREALSALRQLSALAQSSDEGRRSARVLAYLFVVCGAEARRQADTWVSLTLVLCPPKKSPKRPLSTEEQSRLVAQGMSLYTLARAQWSQL